MFSIIGLNQNVPFLKVTLNKESIFFFFFNGSGKTGSSSCVQFFSYDNKNKKILL